MPSEAETTIYTSDDYEYMLNEDNEVTIIRYNGSAAYLTIPDTLGGNAVKGIGNSSFSDCTSFTSLGLPSRLKSMGAKIIEGVKGLPR